MLWLLKTTDLHFNGLGNMENFDFSVFYNTYIKTFLIFYALICVAFSFLINRILLRFIKTLGTRNTENLERWSSQSKPAIGGISFYIIFLFTIITFSIVFDPIIFFQNQAFLGLLLATSLAFLLGLSDDAYNTQPILKLATQLFCGVLIVSTGNIFNFFESEALNIILSVLWVIGIMNAINMLDNMDGISAVTAMFIMFSCGALAYKYTYINSPDAFLSVGIVGALLGFLLMNWPPAKIFMGDTGSMFLGVIIAYFGVKFAGNIHTLSQNMNAFHSLMLTITIFILPLTDSITVSINRILKGKSPMEGGKDHTTHHLVYKGWHEKKVTLYYGAVGAVNFGWTILFITHKINEISGLIYVNILYVILLSSSLYYNTRAYSNE